MARALLGEGALGVGTIPVPATELRSRLVAPPAQDIAQLRFQRLLDDLADGQLEQLGPRSPSATPSFSLDYHVGWSVEGR
jgi:hypothetical protein